MATVGHGESLPRPRPLLKVGPERVDGPRVTGDGTGEGSGVRWTQVDGVNVAWGVDPGPLRASLVVRIGKADERLHLNGITHLAEHLAVAPLGRPPHDPDGAVRSSLSVIDAVGEPDEVGTFLTAVCTSLGALPVERLVVERRALEAEGTRRRAGTEAATLVRRFGPNGPGLWGAEEHAVHTVDGVTVQAWADQVFTRENAVLVLSGAPPAGLSLPLRSRGRLSVPPLVDLPSRTPGWFEHPELDVGALAVLPHTPASSVYAAVLERELVEVLRRRLAIAHAPTVRYEPYDGTSALVHVRADGRRHHLDEVADAVAATVVSLAERGPSPERMREHREGERLQAELPGASFSAAWHEATSFLLSGVHVPIGEMRARAAAVTDAEVVSVARWARDSLLYALPPGTTLPVDLVPRAPEPASVPSVQGQRLAPLGDPRPDAPSLVVSPDGLTLHGGDGRASTVRFATCRAALAWPDGRRVLVAPDGVVVAVEPTLWQSGEVLVDLVDAATAHVRVPQPARTAAAVPSPPEPPVLPVEPVPDPPDSRSVGVTPAMVWFDPAGRPVNQFGTPLDLSVEGEPVDVAKARRRPRAWRTWSPPPAKWAAIIALAAGCLSLFAGVVGPGEITTVGLPAGQGRDGTDGGVLDLSTWETLFHVALLVGAVAVVVAILALVGVRVAGALLLLGFGVTAGLDLLGLLTHGMDYFLVAKPMFFGPGLIGFLCMISQRSLYWIRHG